MSTTVSLNTKIQNEIVRISQNVNISSQILEEFALFVIQNHTSKQKARKKAKSLALNQLKEAVYKHFYVKNTKELKASGLFQMAINDMEPLNLSKKESWEKLYRKYIDILPNERDEKGPDCINGINIFKYFRPWEVFDLNNETATDEEIKSAYRQLVKVYHPDNTETGNARIFDRINLMYKSILTKF